jgi:ribonuclease H / adenosylcobalamin/alpha-ribazole phosphatase
LSNTQTGPVEAIPGLWPSDRSKELATVSLLLGEGTNNIAEYLAAIEGLKKARSLGATEIKFRMDSQLVVEQITASRRSRDKEIAAAMLMVPIYSVKN